MSKLTKFLQLFCYTRPGDDPSTFNITKALNNNWEKIDTAVNERVKSSDRNKPNGFAGLNSSGKISASMVEGGGSGEDGDDGGYYTPHVSQPDKDHITFSFQASKPGMPSVNPISILLPIAQGPQWQHDGEGYLAACKAGFHTLIIGKTTANPRHLRFFEGNEGSTWVYLNGSTYTITASNDSKGYTCTFDCNGDFQPNIPFAIYI